jgi:hypothetical protein
MSSVAGSAASASATLQPWACATGPVTAKLSIPPTGTAIMNHAMARARRSGGTTSPIQLVAAGAHTASPIPTPRRVANSMPKLTASPPRPVSPAHTAVPMASRRLRLHVSANRPKGTPATAYSTVKTVVSAPSCVSERWNSRRSGSVTAPKAWRS